MIFKEKKAGYCTRCGVQLMNPPEYRGGPWFPEGSVRVLLELQEGGGIHIDLCERCDGKFGPQEFKKAEKCLVRSLHQGIERARDSEVVALARKLSTPEREFSTDRCRHLVDEGRLELKNWTPKAVQKYKAEYSRLKVKGIHDRAKHNELGSPMMVSH